MALTSQDRWLDQDACVRTLTISRPERRNALDPPLLERLAAALAAVEDGDVRALVVTGEGSAFCSGFDLSGDFPQGHDVPDRPVVEVMSALRRCPVPTVAGVNGPAFGAGFELAISCDLRIASERAQLCLPPAKLGIAYAPGGLARLASLVGTAKARWLAFSGRIVAAPEALAMGLVDEVVPAEQLATRVQAVADEMAANAPLAIRAMKDTLNRLELALDDGASEASHAVRVGCYESEDAAEGLAAYADKRRPRFKGR